MIEELLKQENEIREQMVKLYKMFEYELGHEMSKEANKAYKKWLELLEIANEIRRKRWDLEAVEDNKRLAKQKEEKETPKTFVNSFGEATTKYITTATYERARKRQEKEVERFLGIK